MTAGQPADGQIVVIVPAENPTLTPAAARVLLDILVELTETPALEETPHDG